MLAYQQLNLRRSGLVSKAVPIDRADQVVHSVLGLVGEKIYAYIEILCDNGEFTLEKSSSRPSISAFLRRAAFSLNTYIDNNLLFKKRYTCFT